MVVACLSVLAVAGVPHAQAPTRGATDQGSAPPILDYIHASWDKLARATDECVSLADPKLTTAPVVYLPFGMEEPADVQGMEAKCHVKVEHLPRRIQRLGDVQPAELPTEGLLYLPHRYVVPGGRFNEMYGWDSYFILLGLLQDHRDDLARGMVENFFFEIQNYGALLNANRTYYLTRSQPPLLSSMIRAVYEHHADAPALGKVWLAHAYAMAVRDHGLWESATHRIGNTGLARYHDVGAGPVPEMADDSDYYRDVIRWLLAHPADDHRYLLAAPETPDASQIDALASSSCDIRVSHVCARAVVEGHRLTAAFFRGDRAMRESGFDTSFRFGPFSGSTEEFAPVCLNSLLFRYETDLADFAEQLGLQKDAQHWKGEAATRRAAIQRYLWNSRKGFFFDWNLTTKTQSGYYDLAGWYPLWAGLAAPAQAAAVARQFGDFNHPGGLAMSLTNSGTQWDLPYGWAPTIYFAVAGLERYGFHTEARTAAREFQHTVEYSFQRDGTIREKYNVVTGSADIAVQAGYRSNVIGFGWTNGVYLKLREMFP